MSWNNKKESVQKSPSIFPLSLILQFVQKTYYLSFKAQSQDFCQLVTFIFFNQPSFPERDAKGGKKKKIIYYLFCPGEDTTVMLGRGRWRPGWFWCFVVSFQVYLWLNCWVMGCDRERHGRSGIGNFAEWNRSEQQWLGLSVQFKPSYRPSVTSLPSQGTGPQDPLVPWGSHRSDARCDALFQLLLCSCKRQLEIGVLREDSMSLYHRLSKNPKATHIHEIGWSMFLLARNLLHF